MINHYGPTETTVGSCTFDVDAEPAQRPPTVPIGRPIANTVVRILDRRLNPVPFGVAGELCIGGAGVARGYVDEPEQTAAAFIEDPAAPEAGGRLYRTGDRARFLPGGTIEFLGRIDEQVKIRGYRVEPGEVELTLTRHPAIKQAAVVARDDGHGESRLVAYLVASPPPATDELRAFLTESLPEFMVPSTFAMVDELPLTPSGKIDRQALPDPGAGEQAESAGYVAPETPLEKTIAAIWSTVLGVDQIGVDDDFFALGGHSLLATQVVARVRSDFAVDLPLHSLFMSPTVRSLSAEIMQMMGDHEDAETAKLLAQLEGLSDEEADRLLQAELAASDEGARDS
jgi:hypothetical protein